MIKITKTIQLPLTDDLIEKIERMMLPLGTLDRTNTIRAAIAFAHSKLFKDYIEVQKQRSSATDKALASLAAQEIKEQKKNEKEQGKLEALCLLMDEASIIAHPENGRPSCNYPLYTTDSPHKVSKTWVTQELTLLNSETPTLQYHGLGLKPQTPQEIKKEVFTIIEKMGKTPETL